jgi:hypothetical protein
MADGPTLLAATIKHVLIGQSIKLGCINNRGTLQEAVHSGLLVSEDRKGNAKRVIRAASRSRPVVYPYISSQSIMRIAPHQPVRRFVHSIVQIVKLLVELPHTTSPLRCRCNPGISCPVACLRSPRPKPGRLHRTIGLRGRQTFLASHPSPST